MTYCLAGLTETGLHSKILGVPRGILLQALILIALILVMYWIFRNNKSKETAEEILNRRYARGEITKKEFLKIKKDIL